MKKRTWFTGAHLKWLAMLMMLLDHAAVVFYEPVISHQLLRMDAQAYTQLVYRIYMILRCMGRFAFPVFCFLLTEGFFYTRSRVRYLRNLLIFAVLSELPFDIALYGKVCHWEHQNVFLTLALGFACIWLCSNAGEQLRQQKKNQTQFQCICVASVIACAALAAALHTDYGAVGVVVIWMLYELHAAPVKSAAVAWLLLGISNTLEFFSFPFVGAVYFYNGERGRQHKYFFYIFYPAHLLLLALLRYVCS